MAARVQFPLLSFAGAQLSDELRRELVEVWIDDHRVLPDSVFIRFRFDRPDLWSRLKVKIGDPVEVHAGELGRAPDAALITAEVTSVEADFDLGSRYLVVRGYDASHRLHIGRKTRSFNDITDSDLAQRIADDAGLAIGTIKSTSAVHAHIGQINTTDWDFLQTRAHAIGFTVSVRDGRFSFTETAVGGSGGSAELKVGDGLLSFRPRVTGAQQVGSVEARGWDMRQKQPVNHIAFAGGDGPRLDEPGWDPGDLARVFGDQHYLTCEYPLATTDEADALAASTLDMIAATFAEAEGTAEGSPKISTGSTLTITGSGPFDGEYTVSHARHRFDQDGYHTDFTVSGRQERSLLGLSSLGGTGGGAAPIYGAVVALVTDAQDPDKLGRVKLKFPWLSSDYESGWARVAYPGGGPNRGFMSAPEVDDEVLVMFERGDMQYPYVIGGLYNGVDKPPAEAYVDGSDGAVKIRRWKSRNGHEITISDYDDEDHIIIRTGDKEYGIAISKADDRIYVKSKGKVVIEGPKGIELKGGDVTISGGNITLDAQSTLDMKGANATLEGSGQTEIKGGVIKLN